MVRAGMSLVEVTVAFLLAGIGMSAVTAASTGAVRIARRAQSITLATARAASIADSLVTSARPSADSVRLAGQVVAWTVTQAGSGIHRITVHIDDMQFQVVTGPVIPELR